MNKTVLIFGASGYLGLFFCRRLLNNKKFNFKINFSDLTKNNFYDFSGVDVVLYLAVIHQIDNANINFYDVNTSIPILIAKECKKQNIHFIYLSSEQVFASKENYIYRENSIQNSKIHYGNAKTLTEKSISGFSNVCILRTSMIYGYENQRKKNLFNYVDMDSISPYHIFEDSFTKPTLIDELCDCIEYIIYNRKCGIFHAVRKYHD